MFWFVPNVGCDVLVSEEFEGFKASWEPRSVIFHKFTISFLSKECLSKARTHVFGVYLDRQLLLPKLVLQGYD